MNHRFTALTKSVKNYKICDFLTLCFIFEIEMIKNSCSSQPNKHIQIEKNIYGTILCHNAPFHIKIPYRTKKCFSGGVHSLVFFIRNNKTIL